MEMLNKAKERFGFRNVWTEDERICIWLTVPQSLKSLEIEQKWLVSSYWKICGVNSFFVLLSSLLIFFFFFLGGGGDYLRKQFFTSKFIMLFSYNDIASLIFYFDLVSTKNSSTYYFFSLDRFHRTFNTF